MIPPYGRVCDLCLNFYLDGAHRGPCETGWRTTYSLGDYDDLRALAIRLNLRYEVHNDPRHEVFAGWFIQLWYRLRVERIPLWSDGETAFLRPVDVMESIIREAAKLRGTFR